MTFNADELVEDLPAIVQAQGEPFGSTSICAGWYVMREAKRAGLTVMLDGQGGDEVLAGYNFERMAAGFNRLRYLRRAPRPLLKLGARGVGGERGAALRALAEGAREAGLKF